MLTKVERENAYGSDDQGAKQAASASSNANAQVTGGKGQQWQQYPAKDGSCFGCGKFDHWSKNCPKLLANQVTHAFSNFGGKGTKATQVAVVPPQAQIGNGGKAKGKIDAVPVTLGGGKCNKGDKGKNKGKAKY
jgi:hypothetical protein